MKKNKNSSINLILIIIFISFLSAYYIANTGYYEYELQQRTILTNEKIKEFELDVKNKEDIDLKKYLVDEKPDYSNKFTDLMYNVSTKGNKLFKKGLIYLFKKIDKLVEDN